MTRIQGLDFFRLDWPDEPVRFAPVGQLRALETDRRMRERQTAKKLIAELVFDAVIGGAAGLLLNLLGSLILPTYWGSGEWWTMAGFGVLGAVGSTLYGRFRSRLRRKSEDSEQRASKNSN
jgi:hypothetical protein